MHFRATRYGPHPRRNWPYDEQHFSLANLVMNPTLPHACIPECTQEHCHQWTCCARIFRQFHFPASRPIRMPTDVTDMYTADNARKVRDYSIS